MCTDHSGEVAGGEQVPRVEGEEDDGHAAEDEVVEGDVHGRLTAPVGRRHQTGDTQRGATLDLREKTHTSTQMKTHIRRLLCRIFTSLSRVWSMAKYAGIPAASIPSMMASMYTRA